MEQDRVETVLSVVDNYTREIERYRNELKTVTKQITDMGNRSGGAASYREAAHDENRQGKAGADTCSTDIWRR